MALTFRERILRHMVARFEAIEKDVDGALFEWDVVTRTPPSKMEQYFDYVLGIYDTSEKVAQRMGYDERFLNVVFEFQVRIPQGLTDEIGSFMNEALGEVQRVALSDINCTEEGGYQLSLDVNEKGSELEITGDKPGFVAGVLIIEVKYRTKSNNPLTR